MHAGDNSNIVSSFLAKEQLVEKRSSHEILDQVEQQYRDKMSNLRKMVSVPCAGLKGYGTEKKIENFFASAWLI